MISAKDVVYPKVWDKFSRENRIPVVMTLALVLSTFVLAAYSGDSVVAWTSGLAFVGLLGGFSTLYTWRIGSDRSSRIREKRGFGSGFFLPELKIRKVLFVVAGAVAIPVFYLMSISRGDLLGDGTSVRGRLYALSWISIQLSPVVLTFLTFSGLAYVAGRLFVRGQKIGLEMDSSGIYHWWWAGCSFFPWEEISDIQLMRPGAGPMVKLVTGRYGYEANSAETRIGQSIKVRRWARKLNLGGLRTHPGLVYQALFFYLRNPELRDELEDERSVERMRNRDYGKIPLEIDMHGRALTPEEAAAN